MPSRNISSVNASCLAVLTFTGEMMSGPTPPSAVARRRRRADRLDGAHLALALCLPGPAALAEDDAEWADALESELDDLIDGTWSMHLAAAGRVLPVVAPPTWGRAGTTRSSTIG